jgi:hypothetical protein
LPKVKIMPEEHRCSETGRTFATDVEARASESRFRKIQAECDAGRVPELRNGDVIYLETSRYISHGCDDFCGGLAEVTEVTQGKSKGQLAPFVRVAQQADTLHNWKLLAAEQNKLRREHGTNWARPDPDDRPEFNGYWV